MVLCGIKRFRDDKRRSEIAAPQLCVGVATLEADMPATSALRAEPVTATTVLAGPSEKIVVLESRCEDAASGHTQGLERPFLRFS